MHHGITFDCLHCINITNIVTTDV